jgi:V/A-type H+/Na+-transporting ATPase subunit C
MSSDYGYINARVRGMKSKLLAPEFYNEALDATDFRAFMSTLGQSSYGREVEEAQARFEGLKVLDTALARNFYQTARSIATFSDGQAGQLVRLLLLRYDLGNIKTIARAKHAGRSPEDIQASLFPAGELKPAVLDNVAAAPDMAAVAQALLATPTPLRGAFARAAANYQSDKDLYKLELELDRAYYGILLDELKDAKADSDFVRYIKREIDATNLRTALKLRSAGSATSDEVYVSGGKEISRALFDSIVNDRSSGSLQGLVTTSFAAVAETTSLSQAEDVVRSVLSGNAKRLSSDPLDIGVVANFLRMKETETAKLRLLGRGKFYNVPRQRLEQELGNA